MLEDLTPPEQEPEDIGLLRSALRRTQTQLAAAKERNEHLTEVTRMAAFDAMLSLGKVPPVPKPTKDTRKKKPETALWVMTDWQGAKKTTTYDSSVMRRRVLQFAEKAVAITEIQRNDHPVRDVTIAFGGDMIEGLFNFPTQPFEIDATLFEQYVSRA